MVLFEIVIKVTNCHNHFVLYDKEVINELTSSKEDVNCAS